MYHTTLIIRDPLESISVYQKPWQCVHVTQKMMECIVITQCSFIHCLMSDVSDGPTFGDWCASPPDGAIFLNFTIYHWSLPISATHFCLRSNIDQGGTMYLYTVNICFRMNRGDFVLFELMKAKPSRIHSMDSIGPWWESLVTCLNYT